ncbi:hypothetical protein GCK72_007758 [Caenorhabditis remanei]|uniref:Uncharacterized protein n=1 Tax=Caenorhabditis remanei TaxID=31234 RepID=A0A6A5HJX1_CAERE|nr:hypothetical protein GCK72_007758 [Caenorhabditis remanei]KAF1767799.1 hypothetical protein GCK72_007758 [Caenorhabditis remanei]
MTTRNDIKFRILINGGSVGWFCRDYYQSDKYAKCAEDETCKTTDDDYHFCCNHFNYCNFYSTNWFFWVIFFLVAFIIVGLIGVFIWRYRKKRRG